MPTRPSAIDVFMKSVGREGLRSPSNGSDRSQYEDNAMDAAILVKLLNVVAFAVMMLSIGLTVLEVVSAQPCRSCGLCC